MNSPQFVNYSSLIASENDRISVMETIKGSLLWATYEEDLSYPETAIPLLRKLSAHPNKYVRGQVAIDPLTPLDVLYGLLREDALFIAKKVAENPANHPNLKQEIVKHSNYKIRMTAAFRPELYTDFWDLFLADKNINVVRSFARNTQSLKYQTILSSHDDESVRSEVTDNVWADSNVLHSMALNELENERLLVGLAYNANTGMKTLEVLAATQFHSVLEGVTENPNTLPALLHRIAVDHRDKTVIATSAALNKKATYETIKFVYSIYPDEDLAIKLVLHEKTAGNFAIPLYYNHPELHIYMIPLPGNWKQKHLEYLLPYYPDVTDDMLLGWLETLTKLTLDNTKNSQT